MSAGRCETKSLSAKRPHFPLHWTAIHAIRKPRRQSHAAEVRRLDIKTTRDGIAGDIYIGFKDLFSSVYLKGGLAQYSWRRQAGVVCDGHHNGGA